MNNNRGKGAFLPFLFFLLLLTSPHTPASTETKPPMQTLAQIQTTPQRTCRSVCSQTGQCTRCVETCNRCRVQLQRYDYSRGQPLDFSVTRLPIDFKFSYSDRNTSNDICASSHCGTKNCNGGISSFETYTLPVASNEICQLTPTANTLPGVIKCSWRDGYCEQYCQRTEAYSCCISWSQVCT